MKRRNRELYSNEVTDEFIADLKLEYPEHANDDETLQEMAYDLVGEYYADLFINYAYELPSTIVSIANLGLWNGRCNGYKIEGRKLSDIFIVGGDYHGVRWYIDTKGNVFGELSHHDGTHYMEYRMFRPELSDRQIDNFLDAVYNDKPYDLGRYTVRLGDCFGDVMGYTFPNRPDATKNVMEYVGKTRRYITA